MNSQRAGKLKVGSDCSLHVIDVSVEDAGLYTCKQYLTVDGPQYGGDANVYLSVLTNVSLLWVDEAGRKLQRDSRFQVTKTSYCDITLTVTLQREDNNRKWTCQLINNGNKETSIDYTFMGPGSTSSTATQDMPYTSTSYTVNNNVAELPISRIMLFVTLTIMVAIVTITTTMRNQPYKSLHSQAEACVIELQVLDE
ncbi:hypothetical protein UPYG_G00255680 [Umbra pygmaea]|uniref:Ig-like domain-containing protein n=1 Tax=Umbra pygmaea TaxID=75934 RepID=A0ABD0W8D2_UMBPY